MVYNSIKINTTRCIKNEFRKVKCKMIFDINFHSLFLMILILVLQPHANAANYKDGDEFTLSIMHTNDIHGKLENLPKYGTIIMDAKKNTENIIVLDGGDIFLRGEFERLAGEVEVKIFNSIGYDAMVFGNNDFRVPPAGGTAKGANEQMSKIVKHANFDVLLANVKYKSGKSIDGTLPYIIKNISGVNVGVIGVTSLKPQDRNWQEVSDKVFERGDAIVERLINEINEKADVIIVLSHAGIVVDTMIATIPKVSAVIGADDHYVLKRAIYNTYTAIPETSAPPITQNGGEKENYLGRLDLTFKQMNGVLRLVDFKDRLYEDLKDVEEDKVVKELIESYKIKLAKPQDDAMRPAA